MIVLLNVAIGAVRGLQRIKRCQEVDLPLEAQQMKQRNQERGGAADYLSRLKSEEVVRDVKIKLQVPTSS